MTALQPSALLGQQSDRTVEPLGSIAALGRGKPSLCGWAHNRPVTSAPSMPSQDCASTERMVDLPLPEGPMMAVTCPVAALPWTHERRVLNRGALRTGLGFSVRVYGLGPMMAATCPVAALT